LPDREIKAGLHCEACTVFSGLVASAIGVRRLPLPARRDRDRRPLVPALRACPTATSKSCSPCAALNVDHVTIYRWVQRFTPLLADAARSTRHSPGDRWFVDETYVKVNGVWRYVYRAIDQHGQVIDVLLTGHRDAAAAGRFFARALENLKVIPTEVVTDAAPVYPAVLDKLAPATWHHVEQYANNPIEADHGQLKRRLRPMRGLQTDRTAQVVITGHTFIQNLRRGHYELGTDTCPTLRLVAAFTGLARMI
jgi:transposase-like protein